MELKSTVSTLALSTTTADMYWYVEYDGEFYQDERLRLRHSTESMLNTRKTLTSMGTNVLENRKKRNGKMVVTCSVEKLANAPCLA